MYSVRIIRHSTISNYSIETQRDLLLDTAGNLTQIGQWTLDCFHKEQRRIELFLFLTRKNLKALHDFPLSSPFDLDFKKFCTCFDKLDQEYNTGIVDRKVWANGMLTWGTSLTQTAARA